MSESDPNRRGRGNPTLADFLAGLPRRRGRPLSISTIDALLRKGRGIRLPPGPKRRDVTKPEMLQAFLDLIPKERRQPEYRVFLRSRRLRDSDKSALKSIFTQYDARRPNSKRHTSIAEIETVYQALVRYRRSVAS